MRHNVDMLSSPRWSCSPDWSSQNATLSSPTRRKCTRHARMKTSCPHLGPIIHLPHSIYVLLLLICIPETPSAIPTSLPSLDSLRRGFLHRHGHLGPLAKAVLKRLFPNGEPFGVASRVIHNTGLLKRKTEVERGIPRDGWHLGGGNPCGVGCDHEEELLQVA
ncbi:unnamed protein product [Musa hybrid cultivar]